MHKYCGSPMAQGLFNPPAHDEGLPFRAESAGTAALEGKPMTENALAALEEAGIYPKETRSARRVNEATVEEAELVLTMGPRTTNRGRKPPTAVRSRLDSP